MKRLAVTGALCAVIASAGTLAYVRAADEPSGYTGKGQLVVQTALGGMGKITVGGNIAMEELGSRLRVDVLSLAIPGTSATISALVGTQLFPPGGFSLVYDRKDSSLTIWSNAQHKYYTSGGVATPPPSAQVPVLGGGGDLFGAFAFAKQLKNYNVFNVSLAIAGHSIVNGHPASGLNFQYLRTTKDNDTIDVHGTLQFADDLDGVPVEITLAGKTKAIPDSALRLDFTSLVKQTPPDSDFDAPPGYARASSIGEVIGRNLQLPGAQ